jgi:hypothetical protein
VRGQSAPYAVLLARAFEEVVMNFDELWRANLARKPGTPNAIEPSRNNIKVIDPVPADLTVDDPDRSEINRFLDWLERTL